MMKYLTLFLFLLELIGCRTEKPQLTAGEESPAAPFISLQPDRSESEIAARLDSFFIHRYKIRAFNGAVLFARKGRVVFKKAYGYADFRQREPLTTGSAFQLASVSKPLTAYAVMLLKERGRLDYEETVQDYFPEFPYQGITIRRLLTHRSGLPNYMYFADELWPSRRRTISNIDVLNLMIRYHPTRYYLPGRRYNYSNTNYCLLALIIEKAGGKPYAEFMETEIFQPLGMLHTRVYDKAREPELEDVVLGYNKRGRLAENSYLNGVVGDKGIYSSVDDLFRWDRALATGSLVSTSTLQEAYEPAHPDLRIWDNYGFGWRIDAGDLDNIVVYHSGWWKGFRSYLIRKLDEEKTIIVLTNNIRRNYLSVRMLRNLF